MSANLLAWDPRGRIGELAAECRTQERSGGNEKEDDMSYAGRKVKGYVAPQSRAKFHRITQIFLHAHGGVCHQRSPNVGQRASDGYTVGGAGQGRAEHGRLCLYDRNALKEGRGGQRLVVEERGQGQGQNAWGEEKTRIAISKKVASQKAGNSQVMDDCDS